LLSNLADNLMKQFEHTSNSEKVPKHVAIIMDGNGRWARSRSLPKAAGHKKGAEVSEMVVRHLKKLGVEYVTLYAFSSENWSRPEEEVQQLMDLFRNYLQKDAKRLIEEGIRLRFIGERHRLSPEIQRLMQEVEEKSAKHPFTLVLAISYGSRDEIRSTALELAKRALASGQEPVAEDFDKLMIASGVPDPDLLIRTSGEKRLSNFLLWQLAYAELYFADKFWPDITAADIDAAIADYCKRERRYGK
jgi:undecaprenyl diphosphate synthase